MSLIIQKVNHPADLEKVFNVRRIVFVEEQNCPPELEWEHEDDSVHFLATDNGNAVGACRWRKTDLGYKLERFAVLKEYRKKGVGRALIAETLSDLPADAHYVYLNAQVNAMSLYAKFGFVAEGDEFLEAGIKHYKMVKKA
jgi:predicted GNAT family N-acyltransferase